MKFKKIISIALTVFISASIMTACGQTQPEKQPESQPQKEASGETNGSTQEEQPASGTVKILTGNLGGKDDEEMVVFEKHLKETLGLDVKIDKVADYDKVLVQKLQNGEKYDLIYLNHTNLLALQEQEALTDITDKVKSSEIMMNNIDPKEWADIEIDGKYYAGFTKKEVWTAVALNKVHLEKAGINYKEIEPTLDGYYKVFKALKESNQTSGYYPYNVILNETWELQPWFAAIGLKGGVHVDAADGKKYASYSTDEAAPVWEWFKKLYSEGLLDPSCAVDKTKAMREKMGAASQLTSVTVDWVAWVGLHNANAAAANIPLSEYEIVSLPGVKTPEGSHMIRKGNASLWGIPVNAENPDGAFKVLEFFATQEGGELLSIGIKDYDYKEENGQRVLTEIGTTHGKDHGAVFPIYKDFDSNAILGYNHGVEEGLQYGEYASIENPLPKETEYKEIVGKWALQMLKDEISIEEGLKSMRADLVARGITDK